MYNIYLCNNVFNIILSIIICIRNKKWRKEMFYLIPHSTHFIFGYSVEHMVKDNSNSKRGNLLPPHHGLLFPISSKGYLYSPSHRQASTYNGLCYTSYGALAGMRNSSVGSIQWPIAPQAVTLPQSYASRLESEIYL